MTVGHIPPTARLHHRLLVVGASVMREAAFAVWRQMGIEIVLVDGFSTGRYEHLAHEYVALDPRDGSADVATIRQLARSCDGIVTLADNSQLTVAQVAEDVGLPGVGRAAASIARSKLLQRRAGEGAGVRMPRWRAVHAAGDLDDFYTGCDGPAVLKPVDCAGSAGVLRVANASDAKRYWPVVRSMSPSRSVLVEEFVGGREVCVDAVVLDGEPRFVSVCHAEYVGPDGFIAVSARYSASQPDREVARAALRRVASAYELRDGVMQAEFKIDTDPWTLLEVTFRPGGALVPDLTECVTGVNLYEAQARIALGLEPAVPESVPTSVRAAFAQVRFLVGSGFVRKFVPPAHVVEGLPDVKVANQLAMPGQRVRLPLSEDGRAGYAAGWGPDRDRLDAQLREAVTRLGHAMGIEAHGGAGSEAPRAAPAARVGSGVP